jgi:hypothetical protein
MASEGGNPPGDHRKADEDSNRGRAPQRGIVKSANQERFGGSRFLGFLKR